MKSGDLCSFNGNADGTTQPPRRKLFLLAGLCVVFFVFIGLAIASDSTRTVSQPGLKVVESKQAVIDYSNASDGYISIRHNEIGRRIKVRISFNNHMDTYDVDCSGIYNIYPLKYGAGSYSVVIYANVSGQRYSQEYACTIYANISDPLSCYLYPNQKCIYTADSPAVKKADELCTGLTDDMDKIRAIYSFVKTNIHYDYMKAMNMQSGYLPDVDEILACGKGTCYDYASLLCCMMRSQGIPTQLVMGMLDDLQYHAWNKVYVDGAWKMLDATVASQGKSYKAGSYTEDTVY